jgi:hypothetical protein
MNATAMDAEGVADAAVNPEAGSEQSLASELIQSWPAPLQARVR